jgi:hypothetical protein
VEGVVIDGAIHGLAAAEGFEVGDLVKLTIDNRHTTTKSDDIVKNATIQE